MVPAGAGVETTRKYFGPRVGRGFDCNRGCGEICICKPENLAVT